MLACFHQMPSCVEEDIRQRVPHLARRAQDAEVIPVAEDAAALAEHAIRGTCQARGDRFHSAGEVARACRFRDQVHVIRLDRVVDQPETSSVARRSEAAFELTHERDRAKRGQSSPDLQRDMARKPRRELRTHPVRMARARAALAARTRASSNPSARRSCRSNSSWLTRRAMLCTVTFRCDRHGHALDLNCAMFL